MRSLVVLVAMLCVVAPGSLKADGTPPFAAYLHAHHLTFAYVSSVQGAAWVEAADGDLVPGIPQRVRLSIVVSAGRGEPDAERLASIQHDLNDAAARVFKALGISECAANEADSYDGIECRRLSLRIGFSSWRDYDVIEGSPPPEPEFIAHGAIRFEYRYGTGNQTYNIQGHAYEMGCDAERGLSASGDVVSKRQEFEFLSYADQPPGETGSVIGPSLTFDGPTVQLPDASLVHAFEACIASELGVPTVAGVPAEDFDYFMKQNAMTIHAAARFLTQEQRARDIPELVIYHALKKALGEPDLLGEQ